MSSHVGPGLTRGSGRSSATGSDSPSGVLAARLRGALEDAMPASHDHLLVARFWSSVDPTAPLAPVLRLHAAIASR